MRLGKTCDCPGEYASRPHSAITAGGADAKRGLRSEMERKTRRREIEAAHAGEAQIAAELKKCFAGDPALLHSLKIRSDSGAVRLRRMHTEKVSRLFIFFPRSSFFG